MGIEGVIKIGVATKDMEESYRLFTDVLGMAPGPKGPYEAAGMRVGLCHLGDVIPGADGAHQSRCAGGEVH